MYLYLKEVTVFFQKTFNLVSNSANVQFFFRKGGFLGYLTSAGCLFTLEEVRKKVKKIELGTVVTSVVGQLLTVWSMFNKDK